jgi:hypothetical protein
MPYAPELKRKIDELAAANSWRLTTKPMFGGLAYFVANQNMCFAIMGKEVLFRVGAERTALYGKLPGVHEAAMGKRLMKNWLLAGREVIADQQQLQLLLLASYDHALELPPVR